MAEEKAAEAAAPAASAGGGKLLSILVIVNLLVTLGMLGVLFMSFQREKTRQTVQDIDASAGHEEAKADAHGGGGHGEAKKEAKKTTAQIGKILNLDQFTVNLSAAGAAGPKYVRVNISIEVPNDETEAELGQKMAQVRNAIIDLFNSKRPADLATAEGRDYLKDEIKNAINGFMVTGKVRGVFFTNFAISS